MIWSRAQQFVDSRRPYARDTGFTLIELLVVVLVIGVLAAIAIPVYSGAQSNAKDSAVKSDLYNAKLAVLSFQQQSSGRAYPNTVDSASLANYGYSGATAVAWDGNAAHTPPAANTGTFCLKATSASSTVFYMTDSLPSTSTRPSGCV